MTTYLVDFGTYKLGWREKVEAGFAQECLKKAEEILNKQCSGNPRSKDWKVVQIFEQVEGGMICHYDYMNGFLF